MKNLSSRLNKLIELQTLTETADTGGGFTSSWSTTATVWAEIKNLNGREFFSERLLQKELSLLFTIRYMSGITSKMRIKFSTRLFNIREVVNIDERNELLELTAEEFVAV